MDEQILADQPLKPEPIKRIYSFRKDDHTVLTIDNSSFFIECLEQVHSFVDCCHDQFDPARMSSFFKINKAETKYLRDLIWYFSFGYTGDTVTTFKTNKKEYNRDNNIHKLAEALDRNPSNKFGFSIQLPGSANETNCDYVLPEMIELPWDNGSTKTDLKATFATYKFHNYTPDTSEKAGALLKTMMSTENTAYILDCGKRLFHENFTNKGLGISIFSGIIDSSTVNDPVLDISHCPDALKKLQFLIPFINIPNTNVMIDMYCTFDNYEEAIQKNTPVKLFLAFLLKEDIQGNPDFLTSDPTTNKNYIIGKCKGQTIIVTGEGIPDLTNVTNYLAGPVRGCFHSLTNTFLKTTGLTTPINPCYLYEEITTLLYDKIKTDFKKNEPDFKKIFQIRFKHIGDKTRLMDAVMINSLSAQYPDYKIPLCHTGTIDTFSNRYALLGNLYTVTPIKKSNLFINDNKILSPEQIAAIETFKKEEHLRAYTEQKDLFHVTETKKADMSFAMLHIVPWLQNKIDVFKKNLIKRVKTTRSVSCLLANYWDVMVKDTFIDNCYAMTDITLIESMEIMLEDILSCFNVIMEPVFLQDMTSYFSVYDPNGIPNKYDQPLHILLDTLQLSNLFLRGGIQNVNGNIEANKTILSIATGIAKSDFSPELYRVYKEVTVFTGGMRYDSTFYAKIYTEDVELSNDEMEREMKKFGITMIGNQQALQIPSDELLLNLQSNFMVDKIKHEIYENEYEMDDKLINRLYENDLNDSFLANLIQHEINEYDNDDDDSARINLNDVFNQEVVIISSLYEYQKKIASKEMIPKKKKNKTKNKKSRNSPLSSDEPKRRRHAYTKRKTTSTPSPTENIVPQNNRKTQKSQNRKKPKMSPKNQTPSPTSSDKEDVTMYQTP